MSFSENIENKTLPIRNAILAHPFITGVGDGSLNVAKFKYYVMQDYAYLIDYSRVLALASARAPDLETMGWFAGLLNKILNVEMDLHRSYCAEFGITAQDLEATEAAPTTVAYTSYLLKVAHHGTFGEIVASLMPCQWGYWDIGDYLARQGVPTAAPLYAQWIQVYASPEFAELAQAILTLADRIAEGAGRDELAAMDAAYLTSLRLEHMFWDMSYNLEGWAV